MTRPISNDLRQRVIEYIELGNNRHKASQKYSVSYSSVTRWYNKYKETGSYDPIPYPGKKAKVSYSEFSTYVNAHPNATLSQLGVHFGISAKSMHYYMKKYGYSYKKKSYVIWKPRNSKEENMPNE